jgi:hypothetical protein
MCFTAAQINPHGEYSCLSFFHYDLVPIPFEVELPFQVIYLWSTDNGSFWFSKLNASTPGRGHSCEEDCCSSLQRAFDECNAADVITGRRSGEADGGHDMQNQRLVTTRPTKIKEPGARLSTISSQNADMAPSNSSLATLIQPDYLPIARVLMTTLCQVEFQNLKQATQGMARVSRDNLNHVPCMRLQTENSSRRPL